MDLCDLMQLQYETEQMAAAL